MFYEIEMFSEYIDGCINAITEIENTQNIIFDFVFNFTEYFESIDTDKITKKELMDRFDWETLKLTSKGFRVISVTMENEDPVYNISSYRRDLNYKYCDKVDFVLWGETDSLWPKETFQAIESISEYANRQNHNRYIIAFAYRKMWDDGWKPLEHVDMTDLPFVDTDDWNLNALESPKSYMTIDKMNEINSKYEEFDIRILNYPKFDGSCLVISSDLIKSGVNIPHALLCSGEDTSFADMAKIVLGDQYMQFIVKNILRVHNRRHPKKRSYIKNENNPRGFCDANSKGQWWKILESMSKHNLGALQKNQSKFYTYNDVLTEMEKVK